MKKPVSFTFGALNLEALEHLSRTKGISKSASLRQAIRLYCSLDKRLSEGGKLFVEGEDKQDKAELLVL
ncbi:MAG: CopG family transcriptional regulator [Verrucomicrobiota bacterium]